MPNAYPCGLVWDFAYDPTFAREAKELFVTTERFTKRDQSGLKALFEPFFKLTGIDAEGPVNVVRLAETIQTLIGALSCGKPELGRHPALTRASFGDGVDALRR